MKRWRTDAKAYVCLHSLRRLTSYITRFYFNFVSPLRHALWHSMKRPSTPQRNTELYMTTSSFKTLLFFFYFLPLFWLYFIYFFLALVSCDWIFCSPNNRSPKKFQLRVFNERNLFSHIRLPSPPHNFDWSSSFFPLRTFFAASPCCEIWKALWYCQVIV